MARFIMKSQVDPATEAAKKKLANPISAMRIRNYRIALIGSIAINLVLGGLLLWIK